MRVGFSHTNGERARHAIRRLAGVALSGWFWRLRLDACQGIHPTRQIAALARHANLPMVLRVEMRACRVGRPCSGQCRQHTLVPQRHQRCKCRVQTKGRVERQGGLCCAIGHRQGDGRAQLVVVGVAMRHQGRQPIVGTAQKQHDKAAMAGSIAGVGALLRPARRQRPDSGGPCQGLQSGPAGEAGGLCRWLQVGHRVVPLT